MMTTARVLIPSLDGALAEFRRWRLDLAGFSVKTWAGEKSGLLAFIDLMVTFGVTSVDGIERAHVEAWWLTLPHKDSTKATRLSQLRTFLGFCVEQGWLTHDPSALLRAEKPLPVLRERLDPGELLALLEAADGPRDRILLALCMNLGLRSSEIKRLTVRDVDLSNGEITVRVEKTRTAPDPMPITEDLAVELRLWLAEYFRTTAQDGLTNASYLVPSRFVVPRTGRVIYRHSKPMSDPEDAVHKALARVGWDDSKGEGVHTVRRSVARIYFDMIEETESFDSALLATMTLLHHTRPETTIRYIGRDRLTLARDRILRGQPFLTKLAAAKRLRSVK